MRRVRSERGRTSSWRCTQRSVERTGRHPRDGRRSLRIRISTVRRASFVGTTSARSSARSVRGLLDRWRDVLGAVGGEESATVLPERLFSVRLEKALVQAGQGTRAPGIPRVLPSTLQSPPAAFERRAGRGRVAASVLVAPRRSSPSSGKRAVP